MAEQRRLARQRVLMEAKLDCGRHGSLPCQVRDLSSLGARVRLPAEYVLPAFLNLEVGSERLSCAARVRWSRGSEAGLMFSSAAEFKDVLPPALPPVTLLD